MGPHIIAPMVEHDPVDLEGQDKAKAAQQLLDATRAEVEVGDFKWVMSNPRGRRFVWRLLTQAGVFRSSFTGSSETFFREGERNIGLKVLAMVHEHAPGAYSQMLEEQRNDEQRAKRSSNN